MHTCSGIIHCMIIVLHTYNIYTLVHTHTNIDPPALSLITHTHTLLTSCTIKLFTVLLWCCVPSSTIWALQGCLQCCSEWSYGAKPCLTWIQVPPGTIEICNSIRADSKQLALTSYIFLLLLCSIHMSLMWRMIGN